jgi:hypothetical protein
MYMGKPWLLQELMLQCFACSILPSFSSYVNVVQPLVPPLLALV